MKSKHKIKKFLPVILICFLFIGGIIFWGQKAPEEVTVTHGGIEFIAHKGEFGDVLYYPAGWKIDKSVKQEGVIGFGEPKEANIYLASSKDIVNVKERLLDSEDFEIVNEGQDELGLVYEYVNDKHHYLCIELADGGYVVAGCRNVAWPEYGEIMEEALGLYEPAT